MGKDKSQVQLNLLTKESEHVATTIRQLEQSGQRIIALAVTVLGLGLMYGVKEGVAEILLVLPLVLFGIASYAVHTYTEVVALGGYRRYLEEMLNSIAGAPSLRWESAISHQRHGTAAQFFLYSVYILIIIISVAVSLHTAVKLHGVWLAVPLGIVALVYGAGLLVSVRAMFKAFDRAYEAATAGEKGKP